MMVAASSSSAESKRSLSRAPASLASSNSLRWSVSRISTVALLLEALAVLPTQIHHLRETVIAPGKAKCFLPVLFSRLPSGDTVRQLGKLVLQLCHTFFKRLRHAWKIAHCRPEFQHESSAMPETPRP